MKSHTNKIVKWDYFVAVLFLATSGAVFWHGMSPAFAFSTFFLVSLINSICVSKDFGRRKNVSKFFIVIVVSLCLLNYLVNNVQYKDNSTFGYIVCLLGAYFVITRYDFYYFRSLLTNVVYVITLIGLPCFLLSELDLLTYYTVSERSGGVSSLFLIYNFGNPLLFHRYSGIWHEPGACQVIMNTVLWLHFDKFVNWRWEKGDLKKIFVILLGSLMTMSTGGYFVLMMLSVAITTKIKIKSRYKFFIYSLLLIFVVGAIYTMYNSPVIQNKLFDADGESISKMERFSDINALWRMTLEKPFLGYGLGSVEFWQVSDKYGNTSCSCGILTYSAALGFSWMFTFLLYLWSGISKMKMGKGAIFLFISVILMQFNEKFIEYPITSLFIFYFASYNININKSYLTNK